MTDEERRIITAFVERISGAAPQAAAPSPWGGSVPQTQAPPSLPPVDPEADRLLWELFNRYPEARYRITQTAFVQEAALIEAQNRIRQLEWEVENARRQGQAIAAQAGGQRGGLFGGMFGGGSRQPMPAPMPPPPQPQYPPNYNPQAMQQMAQPGRGGSGFLGTALTTAAGVAGGMVLGNMLMNAFSGHHGAAQAGGLFGGGTQEALAGSPWTDPAAAGGWGGTKDALPAGQGGGDQSWGNADYASSGGSDQGWGGQDQGGWDTSTSDYGGSSDGGFDSGGGDENI